MEEHKIKECKFLGCHSGVYEDGALFCGKHERVFNSGKKTAVKAGVGVIVVTVGAVVKTIFGNKDK